jgi:hypothetical protein
MSENQTTDDYRRETRLIGAACRGVLTGAGVVWFLLSVTQFQHLALPAAIMLSTSAVVWTWKELATNA